ncbi:MAG: glycosyltransferase family 4 protein [Nitrolancea sp.]
MRIAIVAPLIESVPPQRYGGTERVVSILTEELVRRGHEITLFASGDSRTAATLETCAPSGLRIDPTVRDTVAYTMIELGKVYTRARDFDLIHNHADYFAFPFARLTDTPTVTTTHGRLDLPEIQLVYQSFPETRLIAISQDQRASLGGANWIATVPNGIDLNAFHYRPEPGNYLVFLGRISPEKRVDRAIEIAHDVGMRLVIAAKVDPAERSYYEQAIAPLIRNDPLIDYIGEIDEHQKDVLLGGAYAYLFPISWPEPFGLTMIESMATGTPVIAYRVGSVPEIVVDGVTGFVCASMRDMIDAVERVGRISRKACRSHVEQLFSATVMADRYERAYESLLTGRGVVPRAPSLLMRIDQDLTANGESS